MERYYQPEIECASQEQIRAWQDERLVKQVRNVWDNVPYYRKKMAEKGLTPDDIQGVADLHKLPFVTKADLREAYPCGLLARPMKDCVRIHSTSGTTGKRVVAFYTQHDVDLWEDCCARALVAAGATDEDVCQVSYGYGLFTGGAGLHGGSHKVGCLTIPASSGNTERQIMFIKDLNATILCCTPSYAAYLGESMKELGMTQDQIPLKAGIFGAEAWSEEMRQDIQNTLGIKAYDIYGLTELSGPGVSYECSEQKGMHICEDHFIAEIIDPDTGEVRNTTKKDVEKLTRVVDALDVIPVCERMAGAQDYPEQVAELHNYEALLMNTTKHVFTGGGNGKLTQYMIDMAKAAVGEENFEERCPVTFNTCPISPLKLTADVCEVIMTAARNGATVNVLSMGMAGGSTPVNLAGALVVHNCEALAGLVLAQTTRRGAKFIYGSSSTAMDLRYGAAVVGTPELAVLNAGVAAMARYYKLPSWAAGG